MKPIFILVIISGLILAACSGSGEGKNSKEEAAINPANVVLVDMDVRGMTCTDCENTIKDGINELAGIVDVSADFKAGLARVDVDTSITTVADLKKAVENRGYSVARAVIRPAEENIKTAE
jgi:copper chaperone CopZ